MEREPLGRINMDALWWKAQHIQRRNKARRATEAPTGGGEVSVLNAYTILDIKNNSGMVSVLNTYSIMSVAADVSIIPTLNVYTILKETP